MRQVPFRTAWRKFRDVVFEVLRTGQPIELTRYNRVVARIVPADSAVQPAQTIFEHALHAGKPEKIVTQVPPGKHLRDNLSLETTTLSHDQGGTQGKPCVR